MTFRHPLRRQLIGLTLGLAATSAMSTSFMLAPGVPSTQELNARIVAGQTHLQSILKGADLEAFQKMQQGALQRRPPPATWPPSDVRMHSEAMQAWEELEPLLTKHDPAFLKELLKQPRVRY